MRHKSLSLSHHILHAALHHNLMTTCVFWHTNVAWHVNYCSLCEKRPSARKK